MVPDTHEPDAMAVAADAQRADRLDQLPLRVLHVDADHRIAYVDEQLADELGYPGPYRLLNRPLHALFETVEDAREWMDEVRADDTAEIWTVLQGREGRTLRVRTVASRTHHDGGVVAALVVEDEATTVDPEPGPEIVQQELHRTAEWSRAMTRAADSAGLGLAIAVVGPDSGPAFTYVNDGAAGILGRDRDDLLGSSVFAFLAPSERERLEEAYRATRKEGRRDFHGETEIERPDGTRVPVEVGLSSGHYWSRPALFVFLRDITEEVDQRRKLEHLNAYLDRAVSVQEAALDATADGILVVDLDADVLTCNDRFQEMWGIPDDVLATQDDERLLAHVLDQLEDPDAFMDRVREVYDRPEAESRDIIAFEDGRVFERYSRPQRLDGEVIGRVWSFRDITDQREARRELERSNEELQQFAHVLSHDLKEPVRMVASFARLLGDRLGDDLDQDHREMLDHLVDGAERMEGMISGLLTYARIDSRGPAPEPVDLDEILDGVEDNLSLRIDEEDATVVHGDLPVVEGDPDQLTELFQNLLANALTYRSDAPPRIEVSARRRDGDWVIDVADNGRGMDDRTRERAFEVFQQGTGADEEGMGLGLALCKRIVERHGGGIALDSAPGKGTTVRLTLPAVDPYASTSRSSSK